MASKMSIDSPSSSSKVPFMVTVNPLNFTEMTPTSSSNPQNSIIASSTSGALFQNSPNSPVIPSVITSNLDTDCYVSQGSIGPNSSSNSNHSGSTDSVGVFTNTSEQGYNCSASGVERTTSPCSAATETPQHSSCPAASSRQVYQTSSTPFTRNSMSSKSTKRQLSSVPYWFINLSGPTRPTNKINGSFQSPINLTSSEAVHDPQLLQCPLVAHYQLTRDFELINTGYVLQLSMRPRQISSTASEFNLYDYSNGGFSPLSASSAGQDPTKPLGTESVLLGGPLEGGCEFQLIDIIFHWGKETDRGSEHTVNFKAYPMEVQLVHWNCSLYASYEEALGKPHGVCICALFVQIGREHSTLKMIIDHIEEVQFRGRSKRITTALSPSSFLPDPALRDYWVYPGSLTIPPCHENVTWILYRYPLTISHSQLEEFRRLKTFTRGEAPTAGYEGQMVDNFRPTQALCDRKIRSSFKP